MIFSKKIIIFFSVLAIACAFLIFAKNAYPVPAGDSQFFLVPAVQLAENGKLVTPLFPDEKTIDFLIDPSGARRFLFEPPLFPLFLEILMPIPSVFGIFWSLAFLNVAILILNAFLFYKVIVKEKKSSWVYVLLVLISILALASGLGESGRPEILVQLLVNSALLVLIFVSQKYAWIFYGIILGAVFAIHPGLGVMAFLILGIYYGVILKLNGVTLRMSAILFIAFFITLGIIKLGPFGIKETIEGTWANAITISHALSLGNQGFLKASDLLGRYIISQTAPFYGFVVLLVFMAGIYFVYKYRKKIASLTAVFIFILVLIVFLIKSVFPGGHASYITAFAPLIFLILIRFFLEVNKYLKILTIFILVLVSTGFIRTALLFPFFIKQNEHLTEVRVDFAKFSSQYKNKGLIGITGGLWTLTENYEGVYSYNVWPEKPKENTDLIFFQQRYSGMLEPPKIENCNIIEDKFSREIPKFLGIRLANTMPGYGYAAYSCFKNETN